MIQRPNKITIPVRTDTRDPWFGYAVQHPSLVVPLSGQLADGKSIFVSPGIKGDQSSVAKLVETSIPYADGPALLDGPGTWFITTDNATKVEAMVIDAHSCCVCLNKLGVKIAPGSRLDASRGYLYDQIAAAWKRSGGLEILGSGFSSRDWNAHLTAERYGRQHAASREVLRSIWSNAPDTPLASSTTYSATAPRLLLRNNASSWGVLPSELVLSVLPDSSKGVDDFVKVFVGLIDGDPYDSGGATVTGVSPNLYQPQPTLTNLSFYTAPTLDLTGLSILAYHSTVIPNGGAPIVIEFDDEAILDQTGAIAVWVWAATARNFYYRLGATRT